MYKKYGAILLACNMILLCALFNLKSIQATRLASTPAFQIKFSEDFLFEEESIGTSFFRILQSASSGQRIINYQVVEKEYKYELSPEDYEALTRIVEAEASGEDEIGRILIANVVLNRVASEKFPDSVKDVVFQADNGTTQFSPVKNGRYYEVNVSEATIKAVEKALEGEDYSQGALYFAARKHAEADKMAWFDTKLNKLFTHGGHEFYS